MLARHRGLAYPRVMNMMNTKTLMNTERTCDVVSLFSGGLDSILAVKVLEEQGLRVKALHFTSPFFGKPWMLRRWREDFGIDVVIRDLGTEFCDMLVKGPVYGFGKVLNPCVDCKILMAATAAAFMRQQGAFCLASGEVLGQRPMSQRRDTLNIIRRDAGVRDVLLRPLSAKRLDPTPVEEQGLVDRERLLAISGRGRRDQLALAEKYKLPEIPTPAGGCMLAEVESARRYWPLLRHFTVPRPRDFMLANIGRQYWSGAHWLVIGRNQADNQKLEKMVEPGDYVFKTQDFPGPMALGRPLAEDWSLPVIHGAAAFVASFSPKACKAGGPVMVRLVHQEREESVQSIPNRNGDWLEPGWEQALEEKKAKAVGVVE